MKKKPKKELKRLNERKSEQMNLGHFFKLAESKLEALAFDVVMRCMCQQFMDRDDVTRNLDETIQETGGQFKTASDTVYIMFLTLKRNSWST